MCVIIHMKPNTLIDRTAWDNAVNNNEHGFGMIVKVPNDDKNNNSKYDLILVKEFDEKGLSPEKLWEHVVNYKEYDRWIHLRYKTVGSVSEENVQPFLVYENKEENKIAYFMHNGTLNGYKPSTYGDSKLPFGFPSFVEVDSDIKENSDTQNFSKYFLTPVIPSFYSTDIGVGDYTNKIFTTMLETEWNSARQGGAKNRGIIISNYTSSVKLNPDLWTTYYNSEIDEETGEYDQFTVSNDDYLDQLVRGSLFDKIESEKKARIEKEAEANRAKNRTPVPLLEFRPNSSWTVDIPDLVDIFNDPDIFDENSMNAFHLSGITYEEWLALAQENEDAVIAYVCQELSRYAFDVITKYNYIHADYDKLEEKNKEIVKQNLILIEKVNSLDTNKEKAKVG